MVNGFVMVGSLLMNKSPVTLEQITPIARITQETQVIVVPANSPIKSAKDLAAAVKTDVAKVPSPADRPATSITSWPRYLSAPQARKPRR